MLNPNNIKGKTFDTEKNGYSKEDVKEFLGQVAEDYAEVVKANQDTEAKIIKLVEKINEYRGRGSYPAGSCRGSERVK